MKKVISSYDSILSDMRLIRIQGAENVAKASVKAYLLNPTFEGLKEILATRPTEPLMQNFLMELSSSENPKKTAKKLISDLEKNHNKIAKIGAKLIKNEMNIFSHCHSTTVISILKEAKKQGKNFVVYTTEVHPLLQGRKTAEDLAKAKIKTIVLPDLSAEEAIKKCDLFLFGADAFLPKGVVNKIGTHTFCDIAKRYGVPRYSCGVSGKFAKKIQIEKRSGRELWDERNKLIDIYYPAFDLTKYKFLSGIISELGILTPKQFVKKMKK